MTAKEHFKKHFVKFIIFCLLLNTVIYTAIITQKNNQIDILAHQLTECKGRDAKEINKLIKHISSLVYEKKLNTQEN